MIFRDATSGIIQFENQISLGMGETVMTKVHFEEWLWKQAAAKIKHLQCNNGNFNANIF